MAEGMPAASGKRFAADLRRIREARGLRVDDLHEATRIPLVLIESFERTALFDHPMFNRVYLRSFVRTYANFLDISVETALEALDEAIEGSYQGRLVHEYLGEEPQAAEDEEAPEAAEGEPEGPPGADERKEPEADGETPERQGEAPSETGDVRRAKAPKRPAAPPEHAEPSTSRAAAAEAASEAAEPAWNEQSPPGGAARARHAQSEWGSPSPLWWGAVALGVLGLIVLLFIMILPPGDSEEVGRASPAGTTVDTNASDEGEASAREVASSAGVQLGDMMHLTIVAEGGPVRGLRITRDSDLRRPYWIEEGEATVFPAERRIVVENPQGGSDEFQDVRLLLEGYEYPKDRRDEQGRLDITRETAQAFLDTQRGEPVTLSAAPDTNRIPTPR